MKFANFPKVTSQMRTIHVESVNSKCKYVCSCTLCVYRLLGGYCCLVWSIGAECCWNVVPCVDALHNTLLQPNGTTMHLHSIRRDDCRLRPTDDKSLVVKKLSFTRRVVCALSCRRCTISIPCITDLCIA